MRIILIIISLLIPSVSFAFLPVMHPESIVTDIQTLAKKTGVVGQLKAIGATEQSNAKALNAAKKETAKTIQKINEVEASAFAALMKQHLISGSATDTARQFSPASRTSTACKNNDKVEGAKAQVAYQKELGGFLADYNENNTDLVTVSRRWLEAGKNDKLSNAWGVFPQKGTVEGAEDALAQVALLTNPTPPVKLNPTYSSSPSGQYYESLRKLHQAKLAVPQKVMTDIVSANLPVHDLAERQQEIYAEKGLGDETINNIDGKISSNAVLDMEVAARYGNAVWQERINTNSQTGVIRELLEAEIIDLKMQYNLLKIDTGRLAIYSQRLAQDVSIALDEQKNLLRKKAKSIETN